jgi:hypothetical protein
VQRCWIVRAPQSNGSAHQQREHANRGANDIQRRIAAGNRRDLDVEHLLLAEPQHGIGERIGARRIDQRALDIVHSVHGRAVDGDKHIARPDACRHRTAASRNVGRGDPFRTRFPQHTVLEFVRRRADCNVQRAKAQQDTHQGKKTPASQRTPLRSMVLVFHRFTVMWGTLTRLQTLYPKGRIGMWP